MTDKKGIDARVQLLDEAPGEKKPKKVWVQIEGEDSQGNKKKPAKKRAAKKVAPTKEPRKVFGV